MNAGSGDDEQTGSELEARRDNCLSVTHDGIGGIMKVGEITYKALAAHMRASKAWRACRRQMRRKTYDTCWPVPYT